MIKDIYFDMDGVLADWYAGFDKMFPGFDLLALPESERRKYVTATYEAESFYTDLDPFDRIIQISNELHATKKHSVRILSSLGNEYPEKIAEQKRIWLMKHGVNFDMGIFVQSGIEKAEYASSDSLLIDDSADNIEAFKAAGGHGFLFDAATDSPRKLLNKLRTVTN